MIKCICFDLDDTLWAVDPVIKTANQTLYHWLADNAPRFNQCYQLDDFPRLRQEVLAEHPQLAYSVSQIRRAVLLRGLRAAGYPAAEASALADAAFSVFHRARQQVEFFEGALACLQRLQAAGYRLGAISNGNADIQQVGLAQVMDFQISADQTGAQKPDPLIFRHMLTHTGLSADQVVHVGDHPEHDVAGAARLGIGTVWVNLTQRDWPLKDVTPDAQIHHLAQLPELLAGWPHKTHAPSSVPYPACIS